MIGLRILSWLKDKTYSFRLEGLAFNLRLDTTKLKPTLERLTNKGLVQRELYDESWHYKITPKGLKYLELKTQLNELMNDD